jgi:L-seryl-tRNA(Ser) seleniumtransferase
LASKKNVITSRGELVEIGGSFRIPDVCAQSGCNLVEVGTTNRTHLHDYKCALENAATQAIGAVLRVHASNFSMTGFVARCELGELAALARAHGVPLIEDLGSGAIVETCCQPTVAQSIRGGADIVTFSGDKLLGGAQAGIIAGRADLIAKMKAHPLARALRIDKLSLAATEATLRLYLEPEKARREIPVLRMLNATPDELREKAERIVQMCGVVSEKSGADVRVCALTSYAGGGAAPGEDLPSWGVAITHQSLGAVQIEEFFRRGEPGIVGRILHDEFVLDMRTVDAGEFHIIAERLEQMEASCVQ